MVEEMNQEMGNISTIQKGDTLKGKITKIDDKNAFVDVGYKFDGLIPIGEASNLHIENISDVLKLGDEVELKVLKINDEEEKLILSKRAIDSEMTWKDLAEKLEKNQVFEVKVAEAVKGGLVVDVGVRGFIPASLVERHFVENFADYVGRTLRVKVIELDPEKNKAILSQKVVLEEEEESKKQDFINQIKVGDIKDGVVRRLTNFGAFVDIGGVDGLVHVSEISWNRVEKPSDVLKEGDKVQVKVIKIDQAINKISLSIKEVEESPIEKALKEITVGEIYKGKVKRLTAFGAFVEIAHGVEGLVHISQISNEHITKPSDVLTVNQEVKVKVLEINPQAGRISLSIREAQEQVNYQEEIAKYEGNKEFNVTLGDVFGDKLKKFK